MFHVIFKRHVFEGVVTERKLPVGPRYWSHVICSWVEGMCSGGVGGNPGRAEQYTRNH